MNRTAVLACVLCVLVTLGVMLPAQADRPAVSPAAWAARPGIAMLPQERPAWLRGGRPLPAAAARPALPQERLRRQAAQALGLRELTPARPAAPLNVWPAGLHPAPVGPGSAPGVGGAGRVYPAQNGGGVTTRVSVDSAGNQGNHHSYWPSISADGRYVAFRSRASNLVPGDTNNAWDIFVHDRQTGATTRVSVDSAGNQGNYDSYWPSITADGRYVAFASYASNLAPGDTNNARDVFVHDRQTGATTRVSVDSAGNQGNEGSWAPSISADGRYVAFDSYASNLVPGDTNYSWDVFVHDRQTGATTRVSVDSAGNQGNGDSDWASISADGRYVAFDSLATNLVPGDMNDAGDIFVHDRQTGETIRVSVDSAGNQGNGVSEEPSISADGRYVAFQSGASNLVPGDTNGRRDIFVHDRQTSQTTRVSVDSDGAQANGESHWASISADGHHVAFRSDANNLVPGDTNSVMDVFVHERVTGETTRVSVDSAGNEGNWYSWYPSISADGRCVAFGSEASNLVPGDTNNRRDIFVHDRWPAQADPVRIVETGETYPTIQAAIDAAEDGQTVEASPGTYYETINFSGKNITVRSEDPEAPDVVAGTVIDGGGEGSVVTFNSEETEEAVLAGFTITGGEALEGGGIYCTEASPTITRNTITGNEATLIGGGIASCYASPTLIRNTIAGNAALWDGGGIVCQASDATITDNTITGNTAQYVGGGIACYEGEAVITGNTITGNTAQYLGGGGIYCWAIAGATITHNVIVGNEAMLGGGMMIEAGEGPTGGQADIRNNTFSHNSSGEGGSLQFQGGYNGSPAVLTNNIVAFDTTGLGVAFFGESTPVIAYCNVYGNAAGNYSGIEDPTGTDGNISADPLFAAHPSSDGDFHLRSRAGRWEPATQGWVTDDEHSPCIDAGDPERPVGDEPEPHGDRINMGAYGGTEWASKSWTDALPAPTVTAIDPDSGINDGPVDVTITGTNFRAGATAALTREGEDDIEGTEVEVLGGEEITCTFDLDHTAPGAWDVVVTNDDEQFGTLEDGFEVQHVQPDLLIRSADEDDYIGEGIYNETGEGQTRQQDASVRQPGVFHVKLVNHGTVADRFIVTDTGEGIIIGAHEGRQSTPEMNGERKIGHGWAVRYFAGLLPEAEEITEQVIGDGWLSDELEALRGTQEIRVEMQPGRVTPGRDVREALVTARSEKSASRLDAVKAVAHSLPRFQPDLHVHRPVEGNVVGDDIYNDTGAGQTAQHASDGAVPAAYRVMLENDGNLPDRFILTTHDGVGGAPPDGWQIAVFDAPTDGADISGATLGAGWTSPEMAPGEVIELLVEVTPHDTIPGGAVGEVLIRARSENDADRRDAVLLRTTKTALYRPDLLIRLAAEADWLGGEVYSDDGAGQTVTQATPAGAAAVYHLRVVNRGNCPDEYLVTAPALVTTAAAPPGWTVQIFDAFTDGEELTEQVLGDGWQTPELAPGEGHELRLEVTPADSLAGGAVLDALIRATSLADAAAHDTVKAVTEHATDYQPDMLIRNAGETAYIGGGIYNLDGLGQSKAQVVNGGLAVYELMARNDGNVPQALIVTAAVHEVGASATGDPPWSIAFFDALENGDDITAQVRGEGWETDVLQPGEAVEFRLETRLGPDVPGSATQRTFITATSSVDPDAADTVRATTSKEPVHQPDVVIRNAGEAQFIGHDIFNETGEGQTAAQAVPVGTAAVYDAQVHNAGNLAEAYVITLPDGAPEGWDVRLFDAATGGADITDAATGEGWTTPVLAPGEFQPLRLEATPGSAVAPLAVHEALLRAASPAEGGGADAVRADTTRAAVHQPDLIICAAPDGPCLGEGIYNETGEGQTLDQSVAAGETAAFHVTVRNDGDVPDRFTITAPVAPNDGWAVHWRDAPTDGADITAEILGDGWTTPELAPTEQHTLLLHVTPGAGAHGGAVLELTARAASVADPARRDVVGALTEVARVSRPDMLIRNAGEAVYAGEGIFNDTGEGQSRAQTIAGDTTAVFELMLRNAGNAPDEFLVTLDGGILPAAFTEAGWSIALYDALTDGADITAAALGDGWRAGPLAPLAALEFRLEVHPGEPVPGRQAWEALVTAACVEDPATSDTVKATTITRQFQPDAMIRGPADADYLGEGVINDTGEGQTAAHSVALAARATYLVRVLNAGNAPDGFVITSPAESAGGWQIAFFDATLGGADITADVTGAGWTVAPLDPGEAVNLRLEVTALSAEALEASLEALVTATSTGDGAAADTVGALTTLLPPAPIATQPDAGVWLLGVPGLPLNPSADAVFGVPNVVRWDAAAQDYVHFADAPFDVTPGHGYWARFPAGHELSFDGYPLDAPPTVALAPGWNLLGNSLPTTLPWSAVTATGDVDAYAWKLNAEGTDYVLVWSLAGLNWETEIGPWEGFWLRAREPGELTLGAAQGATAQASPATAAAPEWVIQLCARAGESVDGSNFVGVAGDGAAVRVHAPPPLAGGRVSLHIEAAGERHAVSLVGETDRPTWDLVARTDLPDTKVEITFPDLSQVPHDLAVTLTDLAEDRTVNMRTSTGYAFTSGPTGAQRRFRLEARPRAMSAPVITALAAQPTAAGGTQVVYTLSAQAHVEIEVLNIAGRTVGRVPVGRREAGTHTALWSGRGLTGAQAPPGRYLVTVRCAAEDGTQTSRVVAVQVGR